MCTGSGCSGRFSGAGEGRHPFYACKHDLKVGLCNLIPYVFRRIQKLLSFGEDITSALDSPDYMGDAFCPDAVPKRFELPIDGKLQGFEALMFVPYSQMLTDGRSDGL